MDPYFEISRQCHISDSQEEILRRDSHSQLDVLGISSTQNTPDSCRIPPSSTAEVIICSPCSHSDVEGDDDRDPPLCVNSATVSKRKLTSDADPGYGSLPAKKSRPLIDQPSSSGADPGSSDPDGDPSGFWKGSLKSEKHLGFLERLKFLVSMGKFPGIGFLKSKDGLTAAEPPLSCVREVTQSENHQSLRFDQRGIERSSNDVGFSTPKADSCTNVEGNTGSSSPGINASKEKLLVEVILGLPKANEDSSDELSTEDLISILKSNAEVLPEIRCPEYNIGSGSDATNADESHFLKGKSLVDSNQVFPRARVDSPGEFSGMDLENFQSHVDIGHVDSSVVKQSSVSKVKSPVEKSVALLEPKEASLSKIQAKDLENIGKYITQIPQKNKGPDSSRIGYVGNSSTGNVEESCVPKGNVPLEKNQVFVSSTRGSSGESSVTDVENFERNMNLVSKIDTGAELQGINNVSNIDSTSPKQSSCSKIKSSVEKNPLIPKSMQGSTPETQADYLEHIQKCIALISPIIRGPESPRIDSACNQDGSNANENNHGFSRSRGDSSGKISDMDVDSFPRIMAPASPIIAGSELQGIKNVSNAGALIVRQSSASAGKQNSAISRNKSQSIGDFPAKSPAKGQLPKPIDGIQEPLPEPTADDLVSSGHGGKDKGPEDSCPANERSPVDEFVRFRYKKLPNYPKYPSRNVQAPRKLPPSIQGPVPSTQIPTVEKAASSDISMKNTGDDSQKRSLKNFLDLIVGLSTESDPHMGDEPILEAAKRVGYTFPRPRWWPAGEEL